MKKLTKEEKRELFEKGVNELREKGIADFPLGAMEINGKFSHYMDSDTDSAWIGFLLGMLVESKRTPPAKHIPVLKLAA